MSAGRAAISSGDASLTCRVGRAHGSYPGRVDVRTGDRGALGNQVAHQGTAHLAQAGHSHPLAPQVGTAPPVLRRRMHPLQHPVRGQGAGVT